MIIVSFFNIQHFVQRQQVICGLPEHINTTESIVVCIEEANDESAILEIVTNPHLRGKWNYAKVIEPQKMGDDHGIVTLYRSDLLELLEITKIWLPQCQKSKNYEVALVCRFLHLPSGKEIQITNLRLSYEGANQECLAQLEFLLHQLPPCRNQLLGGDFNLIDGSQVIPPTPMGLLSLAFSRISEKKVVRNRYRAKLQNIFLGWNLLIPEGVATIDPLESIDPKSLDPKLKTLIFINSAFRLLTKILTRKAKNIRVLLQIDFPLACCIDFIAEFLKAKPTGLADHRLITVKLTSK